LRRRFAEKAGIKPENLVMREIALDEVRFLLQDGRDGGFLGHGGEWRASTSLFPWVLSESFLLTPEEDQSVRAAFGSIGSCPFTLNVTARFDGLKESAVWNASYEGACLREALLGPNAATGEPRRLGAGPLYAATARVERDCLRTRSGRGAEKVSIERRVGRWRETLLERGLVTLDGEAWMTGTPDRLEQLASETFVVNWDFPEERDSFPVAFGGLFALLPP
jgi:hypothetical protein